jgi:hypothetical protein
MRNRIAEIRRFKASELENAKEEHLPDGYILSCIASLVKKGELYINKFHSLTICKNDLKNLCLKVIGCDFQFGPGIFSHRAIEELQKRDVKIYNGEFKSKIGFLYYDNVEEMKWDIERKLTLTESIKPVKKAA